MSKNIYFSDLGLDFPLFKAPISDAYEYIGAGMCDICHSNSKYCFEFSDNPVLFLGCASCKKRNSLSSHNIKERNCHYCKALISLPIIENNKNIIVCYQCVYSGGVKFNHETEYGYISTNDDGSAHVSCVFTKISNCEFEIVEKKGTGGSSKNSSAKINVEYIVRIPENVCEQLFKTPCYASWQGEKWQFCCKNAMMYIGTWEKKDFINAAPDGNVKKYFYSVFNDELAEWGDIWDNMDTAFTPQVYVFLCDKCGKNKAHFSYS